MKIATTTTAAYELAEGETTTSMTVTLTIDGDGMIGGVVAQMGSSKVLDMTALTFDRIAAVVASFRKERETHPHYQTAPKCCPDHGYYDGYRCEACVTLAERAEEEKYRAGRSVLDATTNEIKETPCE